VINSSRKLSAVLLMARGSGLAQRGSVVSIDAKRERGIGGRALGTAVGALGGMGLGAWVDAQNNVLRHTLGEDAGTFIGIAAGGAVAGYLAGCPVIAAPGLATLPCHTGF
jgi:hypothetical protein